MNPFRQPSSCGCGHSQRDYRPRPEPYTPPPLPPKPAMGINPCGGYLMQRVIAFGRLYRRRECYPICLNCLPPQAEPPYTLIAACVCGQIRWEECPLRDRRGMSLHVTIPLQVRVRDAQGCMYAVNTEIEEELTLRYTCPPSECWRGTPYVQAAVRLAGRACPCGSAQCEAPLEVSLEGYMLATCMINPPMTPQCPPDRPWYPPPIGCSENFW